MIMPNMDMYVASATEALHHELIEGLNLQGYRAAVRAEIYKGRILVDGLTWEGAYKLQDEATRNAIFQRYPYLQIPEGFVEWDNELELPGADVMEWQLP